MPRATRSTTAVAQPATVPKSSTKATKVPAKRALQPKSTNPRKRPLKTDCESNKKEIEINEPAPKKRATAFESTLTFEPEAVEKPQTSDITGTYEITKGYMNDFIIDRKIDITGFSLKIFHYTHTQPHQLYATFEFDKLRGLIRFCPREAESQKFGRFTLQDFEKACELDSKLDPGDLQASWAMRWRGRDGGMQLDQLVGGEKDFQETIELDIGDSDEVVIKLPMYYRGERFTFWGSRRMGLGDEETADPPHVLERKWKELYDPAWKIKANEPFWPILIPKREMKKLCVEQPEKANGMTGPVVDGWNKYIELPPAWVWDVTGHWKISCPTLVADLGLDIAVEPYMDVFFTNNPQHLKIGRQFWASFHFGKKLYGTLRFCPAAEEEEPPCTVKQFEDACPFQKGIWPGPDANEGGVQRYHMRWRGMSVDNKAIEGADKLQSIATFRMDKKEGKLLMKTIMYYDDKSYLLEARRTRSGDLPKGNGPSIKGEWEKGRPESEKPKKRDPWEKYFEQIMDY